MEFLRVGRRARGMKSSDKKTSTRLLSTTRAPVSFRSWCTKIRWRILSN